MNAKSPEVLHLVGLWVRKAEEDRIVAEHTLELGEAAPFDAIGFHAQQCVEKYVKAVLTLEGIPFPKTHDIALVVSLLSDPNAVPLDPAEMRRLTDYATVTRYPGDYEPVTLAEGRAAVEIARRTRNALRRLLPGTCLDA